LHLDRGQERALNGEGGPAREWAMGILVELGDRSGASRLVPVGSVHIPDWCGQRPSEAWTWLKAMAGSASLPVTANPERGGGAAVPERKAVLEALHPRAAYSFSCAPYLSGNHPGRGEIVAWGGRAASSFANSVLGARTEMETFEVAAAAAIAGLVPERGLHLEDNRRPTVAVVVPRGKDADLPSIGRSLSGRLRGEVPLLCGVAPTFDDAKKLAFALNSRGNVPLFRMQREPAPPEGMRRIEVGPTADDLVAAPDLVVLGCPHLSEQDINRWSKRLAGRSASKVEAWFFTSRLCRDKCPVFGAVLRSRGRVFVDRCPLGMISELRGRTVACDSPALADCLRESGALALYASEREILSILTGDGASGH